MANTEAIRDQILLDGIRDVFGVIKRALSAGVPPMYALQKAEENIVIMTRVALLAERTVAARAELAR